MYDLRLSIQMSLSSIPGRPPYLYFWLDGSDAMKEGEWKWMTTGQRIQPTFFWPSEPDNLPVNGRVGQHCLVMVSDFPTYQWGDTFCSIWNNPICKIQHRNPFLTK